MVRLLPAVLPKADAPVLIRLRRLAFLSCCRSLPFVFPSPSSSGVGGSGRSSSVLVLVQSRLYPERKVVRLAPAPAAALLPASAAFPLRGVGGLPPRTATVAVTPPGIGGLVLLAAAEGRVEDEADRGAGGLPPPPEAPAAFAGGTAFFLPTTPVLVQLSSAAAEGTGSFALPFPFLAALASAAPSSSNATTASTPWSVPVAAAVFSLVALALVFFCLEVVAVATETGADPYVDFLVGLLPLLLLPPGC